MNIKKNGSIICFFVFVMVVIVAIMIIKSSNDKNNKRVVVEEATKVVENAKSEFEEIKGYSNFKNINLTNTQIDIPEDISSLNDLVMRDEIKPDKDSDDEYFVEKFKSYYKFFFGKELNPNLDFYGDYFDENSMEIYVERDGTQESNKLVYLEYRGKEEAFSMFSTKAMHPRQMNKGYLTRLLMSKEKYESAPDAWLMTWSQDSFPKAEEIYVNDGSSDDVVYQLPKGKVSIGEAIDFFEREYIPALPFEYPDGQKIVVDSVRVIPLGDGMYCYLIIWTFEYNGIKYCTGPANATTNNTNDLWVSAEAAMIGDRNVDFCFFCSGYEIVETGEPYSKIVNLNDAVEKLNESIPDNMVYVINKISLSYRMIREENSKSIVARPCWCFEAFNENDNKNYIFNIDIETCEISYYARW